jgi:hypothetical protein
MNHNGRRKCECAAVADLASDENCPIEFDPDLEEYNLVSSDGKVQFRLYFCFFCGGALPKSNRVSLYTEPNPKETEQVKKLLDGARTIDDALRELGEPNLVTDAPKAEKTSSGVGYRHHYHYSSRWKTLDLTVRERSDKSFDLAIVGKVKGAPKRVEKRKNHA